MKRAQIGEDLKLALSLSSDGFIIIENYEIIWMNESAEEILGKPEKNHDDRTLDSIFSEENKRKILAQRETRGTNSIEIGVSGKGVFELRIDHLKGKGNQWIVNIK
ncbi:MAG: PAS domain-containing protein, partial [Flavobacteriales bacterium]